MFGICNQVCLKCARLNETERIPTSPNATLFSLIVGQRTASRAHRGERTRVRAISHRDRESNQVDAEKLARYARLDPKIVRQRFSEHLSEQK